MEKKIYIAFWAVFIFRYNIKSILCYRIKEKVEFDKNEITFSLRGRLSWSKTMQLYRGGC